MALCAESRIPDDIFIPGNKGRCPHCGTTVILVSAKTSQGNYDLMFTIHPQFELQTRPRETLCFSACPSCNRGIVQAHVEGKSWFLIPHTAWRRPVHRAVPAPVREDYSEAVKVLTDSPKASAALSRRCLQTLLVLQGAKSKDLVEQLTEIAPSLPGYVRPYVDHIRQLGNISAHAKQSKTTGEIVAVAPGEAEWMLELLEELFDHYYAKPAEAQEKQAALNAKFADAGKLKP